MNNRGRRGQISIDRIVAVRSSVLPLYIIISPDASVTAADEVSEDGNDFLTTKMHGTDQISFQSIRGWYLSAENGGIRTRRHCSADEKFFIEKKDTQYAFRSRCGKYLSIQDQEPFVTLVPGCDETEIFQLFSLMMCGVNVGSQIELLERNGQVMLDNLLDDEQIVNYRDAIFKAGGAGGGEQPRAHEYRVSSLIDRSAGFASLATHPVVLQVMRRVLSASAKLSYCQSCRTDADFVRKELESTTWSVTHPYSDVDFPGIVDERISFTAMWFLDDLNAQNSTWAWLRAPPTEGLRSPLLPQLSSPDDIAEAAKLAKPLQANRGSVWLYSGPAWLSNNIGAASFWKDFDAQTRYKHLSGQKDQSSFRALTDAQRAAPAREELCPTVVQTTFVREYVKPFDPRPSWQALASLSQEVAVELEKLLPQAPPAP